MIEAVKEFAKMSQQTLEVHFVIFPLEVETYKVVLMLFAILECYYRVYVCPLQAA